MTGPVCQGCGDPIVPTVPGRGIDPAEYPWTHEDGNPKCDNGHPTSDGGWDDGTWAEPIHRPDGAA